MYLLSELTTVFYPNNIHSQSCNKVHIDSYLSKKIDDNL